ncbi:MULTISPECIES: hypothetical protein [unclassified Bradyrhizobium]|nr:MULTISPECIES: hypothetical protein [unclassified Bradyrhizobium]
MLSDATERGDLRQATRHHEVTWKMDLGILVGEVVVEEHCRGV